MTDIKTCIWCLEPSGNVSFNRAAHIFPQSLGGKRVCPFVCDNCNSYFGSKQSTGTPSVEIALKEPLNISRHLLLGDLHRNKKFRFRSEYFEYNQTKKLVRPKYKYNRLHEFQVGFMKQFKRGIYKIFLEERATDRDDAYDPKFNFIREFARYGIGDLPVLFIKSSFPAIFVSKDDTENPVIRFTEHSDEEMSRFGFYGYWFMSHYLAIATINNFEITYRNYVTYMLRDNNNLYGSVQPLNRLDDLDYLFQYALSK